MASALSSPPLLVVVGPTASGKTELALRLAEQSARRGVPAEILSADSVQVYRDFNIGSGKPSPEELARAPHHLLDVAAPPEPLEAARWAELAEAALVDITARGARPIVCGGTYLWVRALLYGLASAPPGDAAVRARHQALAADQGRDALHRALSDVDPVIAARLHPNDLVRVSRALEVYELTGQRLSELQADHGFRVARRPFRLVGIGHARVEQEARIQRRVAAMFRAGWLDEVRALLARGYADTRPMGAVGYRQIKDALEADAPVDAAALEAEVYRVTRIFARRQRTWLRDEPVTWLCPDACDESTLDGVLGLDAAPAPLVP